MQWTPGTHDRSGRPHGENMLQDLTTVLSCFSNDVNALSVTVRRKSKPAKGVRPGLLSTRCDARQPQSRFSTIDLKFGTVPYSGVFDLKSYKALPPGHPNGNH